MRKAVLLGALAAVIAVVSTWHLWQYRYFFRIVPLPLSTYELVADVIGDRLRTPPPSPAFTRTLPLFDFATDDGRNAALVYVRRLVPVTAPPMTYEDIDPASWFSRLQQRQGFCTDFSLLLISLADRAGLKAREWILWRNDDWSVGSAHSIAEIQLPDGTWISLDGQHATIIADRGKPLSMTEVLRRAVAGEKIETVRLQVAEAVGLSAAASTSEALWRLPNGVELNLHLGAWTGARHLPVISIPILSDKSSVDPRVWTTKAAALLLLTVLLSVLAISARTVRRRLGKP